MFENDRCERSARGTQIRSGAVGDANGAICRRNRRSSFDLEETDKRGRTRAGASKALSRFTTRVAGSAWLVPSSADAVDRGARSGLGGALRFTWKNVET